MPKTTSLIKLISLSVALASLCACGGGSSAAVSVNAAGKHPANWLQQHYVAYKAANGGSKEASGTTGCSECHGSDLAGGISKVSCFGATFNGMTCHANADGTLGHPASWADPTSSDFHALAGVSGGTLKGSSAAIVDASCGICHDTGTAATAGATGAPSCLSTDPKWGISCHAASPANNSNACLSCHGTPPSGQAPALNKRPNRPGAHDAHTSLGLSCAVCHTGLGSGTAKHATAAFLNGSTAFLKMPATYNAQTGSFSYASAKCSGVSCHGGKLTPAWSGGSIDVSKDCTSCHGFAGQTAQFNSYFSGNFGGVNLHQFHLAVTNPGTARLIVCTDCHNVNALTTARHFGGLDTPAMLDPEKTVGPESVSGLANPTRISVYGIDTTTNTPRCTNSCHTGAGAPNPAHWF